MHPRSHYRHRSVRRTARKKTARSPLPVRLRHTRRDFSITSRRGADVRCRQGTRIRCIFHMFRRRMNCRKQTLRKDRNNRCRLRDNSDNLLPARNPRRYRSRSRKDPPQTNCAKIHFRKRIRRDTVRRLEHSPYSVFPRLSPPPDSAHSRRFAAVHTAIAYMVVAHIPIAHRLFDSAYSARFSRFYLFSENKRSPRTRIFP